MSVVEVRDHALWIRHIHGNKPLQDTLHGLSEGELIELTVDSFPGHWTKMKNGTDGRPTPGIKAVGPAREKWHALNQNRGALVTIQETLKPGGILNKIKSRF